ncbi:helix-turn-helix domain-containing protein [Candidatus Microgenomates bacterium]|nr:helix-turn-helix domain-containing protein [Candidatus Microgenomates bacterium]
MNTIGTFLSSARREKGVSLEQLELTTKIKKQFLEAIEKENWESLPEYPVILGFVSNIAGSLDVPVDTALALLRRDYPPKKLKVTPSPDVEKKFVWSPKLTFAIGVGLFLLTLLGYLGFQYTRFMNPPKLFISKPTEEEIVLSTKLKVSGITDTDAKIEVNNQPILVDSSGNFEGTVEISEDAGEITFVATSRSGKETKINRKIVNETGD